MNLKDHDLDSLSSAFARSKGIPCSTNDDKKDVMTKFSAHILDLIANVNPQKVLEIRIAELEAQNAKLASAPAAPTFAPAFPPAPPVIPAAPAAQAAVPFHRLVRSGGNKYLSKSFPASFKVRELNA